MKSTLCNIPYLRCLSNHKFDELIYALHFKQLGSEEYLFRCGDTAEAIYIIAEGSVCLEVAIKDKDLFKLAYEKDQSSIWESYKTIEFVDKNKHKMNLTTECLKMGSILNPKLGLVGGKLLVSCKAIENTKILILTPKILDEIANTYPPLKAKLTKVKSSLFFFDNVRQDISIVQIALDIIKCYKYDSNFAQSAAKTVLKFKNQVLMLISRKKSIAQKDMPNIKSMIERLKAIMEAEEKGMHDIARKIAIGRIPSESIKILDILAVEELDNPLLTQFASKSKEVVMVFHFLGEQFKYYRERISEFDKQSEGLQNSINEIFAMIDVILQLTVYKD